MAAPQVLGRAPRRRPARGLRPVRGGRTPVWLFDLDNTLHDAGTHVFPRMQAAIAGYMEAELGLSAAEADALRQHYLLRYGATLLGLVRHHGVEAGHFLRETHRLPGLEQAVTGHRHDLAALARLPGHRLVLTNAPRAYAERVLGALGIRRHLHGVITVEDMHVFGDLRPKPDARMLRTLVARLKVRPGRCVLVEDTLVHQKAAWRVGLDTVWMRRHVMPRRARGVPKPRRLIRPSYVGQVVQRLAALCRRPAR